MKRTPLILILLFLVTASGWSQTPPFNRTVIVPATGNASADGTALLTALGGLSPAPSYANRWLVKLEPGIYNVGSTPVVMQAYVDIEGSGLVETMIKGSIGPDITLLKGVVQGASSSEIRELTILCASSASQETCQGMSLMEANPRLTDLRILVQGAGTGSHWGIRTYNSAPKLDRVQILVKAPSSANSYGIVYGGTSTMVIDRSSVVARDGSTDNIGILFKEDTSYSPIKNSSVTAIGGTTAGAIMYLQSYSTQNLLIDNVIISAHGASGRSVGIGTFDNFLPETKVWIRGGRVFGASEAVNLPGARVHLTNTEASGPTNTVIGNNVRIGSTFLDGGPVVGYTSALCAGTYDESFVFYPNRCPY